MPRFLHVGCGPRRTAQTIRGFDNASWEEVRLDIDPLAEPGGVACLRRGAPYFDLWTAATCAESTDEALRGLATAHFPAARPAA